MIALGVLAVLIGAAIIAVLALQLVAARSEMESLRHSIDQQQRLLAGLTRRVWLLENGRVEEPEPAPAAAAPVRAPETIPQPPPAMPPAPERPVPRPAGADWETRLGANWLNRAGALVLVVGVVLFLGYSLTQLGPLGKVGIGFAMGLSLLLGGIALERQETYRGFSISLMAAGWAVLYFTAYAMHGVPAARVIEDPGIAVVLLLLVPAGMIAHALRYRSEAAVGLAYLFGFVGLNVSPLTSFAVIASLVLALSLVALAYRLDWLRLPVAGVVFTYVTFVLRYDPSIYERPGLLNGLSTLWIYWLAFEAFDLLQLRRGSGRQSLFLLNACGFAGASLLHEWRIKADDWSWFLGAASAAYLASAWLRSRWTATSDDGRPGGYEAASTVSAAFLAGALIMRFSGLQITVALLLEGELILLAGAALGSAYLRYLGSAVLLLPFFRILAIDSPAGGHITVAGLRLEHWTPVGVLMAAVFAMNRKAQPSAWFFAAGSGVLVFAALLAELPGLWVAPAWAALAVIGYVWGDRFSQRDLLWMSVPAAVFAFGRAAVVNIDKGAALSTGVTVFLLYAMQFFWRTRAATIGAVLSVCGTLLTIAVLVNEVQGRLLTVALGVQGAALLTAGFMARDRVLRISGLVLFLACIAKLFAYDLRELDTLSRILSFLVLGLMLLGASWLYTRYRDKLTRLL